MRNRSRLIQRDGANLARQLKRLCVANENAILRALARADHDGRRRGKAKRAWAGDDQHRDHIEVASVNAGSGPTRLQMMNVMIATATTVGTK